MMVVVVQKGFLELPVILVELVEHARETFD
jgi:hypothetical protein